MPLLRRANGQPGSGQPTRSHTPTRNAQTRRDRDIADERAAREDAARLWLRAVLLLAALGTLLLYTLSRPAYANSFTAARYLLPLYTALPLVFGVLWQAAGPLVSRMWPSPAAWSSWAAAFQRGRSAFAAFQPGRSTASALWQWTTAAPSSGGAGEASTGVPDLPPPAPALSAVSGIHGGRRRAVGACALAALVLLLGFAAYGAGATLTYAGDGALYALPAPPQDQQVLAALAEHGITRYISDYWTCYRLVFESGERLRCGVRDGVNNTLTHNGAVNRYLPYLLEVERTPHPAYIFAAGSNWDTGFAAWAASQRLPHQGYARFVVAGYAVYYYPGGQG